MKRFTQILLTICFVLTINACGNDNMSGASKQEIPASSSEEVSKADESTKETEKAEEQSKQDEATPGIIFNTVDLNGNEVTNEIMAGSTLVLMNLWEPWCGPCVGEMPDLQKLYEKYKDKGLLILGVYSTTDMDDDAKEVVSSAGVTYPILKADRNLLAYEQDYVPATFLFDGNGNLLESEPIAGSQSYGAWEKIILKYISE